MSSILDALKKADREAAADRSKGTPWPSAIPPQPSIRTRRMWWWISIGLGLGVSVAGLLFFNARNTETFHLETAVKTAPTFQQDREAWPQRSTLPAKPAPPISNLSRKVVVDETAKRPEQRSQTEIAGPNPPSIQAAPLQVRNPPQTAKKSSFASIQPSPPELTPEPFQQPVSATVATIEAPPKPSPAPNPTRMQVPSDLNEVPPPIEKKNYQSDQRVELQALVWAPEPAVRFVVINNQLIREGGSVDNIVVEKINPDDVRLADGNIRWYQKFNVR